MKLLKYALPFGWMIWEGGGKGCVVIEEESPLITCFPAKRPINLHSYLVTSLPQFLFLYCFKQYSIGELDMYLKSALTNNSHRGVEIALIITLSCNLNIIFNDFCPVFFLVSLKQRA